MSPLDRTLADYSGLHLTTGPHLFAHLRPWLDHRGLTPLADLTRLEDGASVRTAGAVIVRQRPGTARGFVFLTLEDDTGTVQVILRPDLFREHRALIVSSPLLLVEGVVQQQDGTLSVRARRLERLEAPGEPGAWSHDFH
jgi:error-prone DNA polymerase